MMTAEERFQEICTSQGQRFLELYSDICKELPKITVLTIMTGSLAACATEGGFKRNNVIDALNSAFDDIEQND